jgi:hypothetical protein
MVLYVIVCPAWQHLCYFGPSVAPLAMQIYNLEIFFICPLILFDARIQVIVPSFPALLSNSSWQRCSYL